MLRGQLKVMDIRPIRALQTKCMIWVLHLKDDFCIEKVEKIISCFWQSFGSLCLTCHVLGFYMKSIYASWLTGITVSVQGDRAELIFAYLVLISKETRRCSFWVLCHALTRLKQFVSDDLDWASVEISLAQLTWTWTQSVQRCVKHCASYTAAPGS